MNSVRRSGPARRILTISLVAIALVAASGCTRNAEAWESFQSVNSERSARGLPGLALDEELVAKADAWAAVMAAGGSPRHSQLTAGVAQQWNVLAENVGAGANVAQVAQAFMASPKHRSAILDPRFNRVGTGVAVVGGRVYVVQVFAG